MAMNKAKKRFYETASVETQEGWHAIVLDGKAVRTPAGHLLAVSSPGLAQAVAEEWQAQEGVIKPTSMPLTQLVSTSIDLIEINKEKVIEQIVSYADTDLLCYWAEEPPALVERQRAIWQPVLDWFRDGYGIAMQVTQGVLPCRQSEAVKTGLRQAVGVASNVELAGLASLSAACGSAILALAVRDGQLDATGAFAAAQLEETYQLEKWGEDSEATVRRRLLRADIEAACRLLNLCRAPGLH